MDQHGISAADKQASIEKKTKGENSVKRIMPGWRDGMAAAGWRRNWQLGRHGRKQADTGPCLPACLACKLQKQVGL